MGDAFSYVIVLLSVVILLGGGLWALKNFNSTLAGLCFSGLALAFVTSIAMFLGVVINQGTQDHLEKSAQASVEGLLTAYSSGNSISDFISSDSSFKTSALINTFESVGLEYGNCSLQLDSFQPPLALAKSADSIDVASVQSVATVSSDTSYTTFGLQFDAENKVSFIYVISTSPRTAQARDTATKQSIGSADQGTLNQIGTEGSD